MKWWGRDDSLDFFSWKKSKHIFGIAVLLFWNKSSEFKCLRAPTWRGFTIHLDNLLREVFLLDSDYTVTIPLYTEGLSVKPRPYSSPHSNTVYRQNMCSSALSASGSGLSRCHWDTVHLSVTCLGRGTRLLKGAHRARGEERDSIYREIW